MARVAAGPPLPGVARHHVVYRRGVRAALLCLALAACERARPAPAPLAALIVPDATSVLAWRPTEFPLLLEQLPDMYRCWRTLETKLEGAYQVFVPGGGSYAILVGDLPRPDVEKCGMQMLLYNRMYDDAHDPSYDDETLPREGAFTVAPTKIGVVYAAWRDGRIVAGRRADVERALATHASPAWLHAGELPAPAAFATSGMIAISTEPLFSTFVGVPTTRWRLAIDGAAQPWPERELLADDGDALEEFARAEERIQKEKAAAKERALQGLPPAPPPAPAARPPRAFTGRLELEYASAADATRAAAAITNNTFAVPLEENLGAAFAKLPQTVSGTTLAIRFTQDSFPGVELDKLQAWVGSLQAAAAR